MSLPTREETSIFFNGSIGQGEIVIAYVGGRLMTETEWIQALAYRFSEGTDDMGVVMGDESERDNSIDYEAAARARKLWFDAEDKSAVTIEEVMDEKMSIEAALPDGDLYVPATDEDFEADRHTLGASYGTCHTGI